MIACAAGSACDRAVPYVRLAVGIFLAAQTMTLAMAIAIDPPENAAALRWMHLGMFGGAVVVLALLGWGLAIESLRQLRLGRVTMELLFIAGILGAMGISVDAMLRGQPAVYFETVALLLVVYIVGQAVNARAQQRALGAADSLTRDLSTARLPDGAISPIESITVGQRVRVLPGDLIPVDGRVIEGQSLVRHTAFTGQWQSSVCREGDAVLAGSAAEDGMLLIEATSPVADRRIDRLAALIDQARLAPTALQRQADRFVRWFLPIVLLAAGGVLLFWAMRGQAARGIIDALAVLLVACPCAAGLATPLATWTAMGGLARRGLVLHSGDAVERLAEVNSAIFDKTGTLGDERLLLDQLTVVSGDERTIRAIVAAIERCSDHPVARLLRDVAPASDTEGIEVRDLRVIPGRGVRALVVPASACPPVSVEIIRAERSWGDAIEVEVRVGGTLAATARIREPLRDSAAGAIGSLGAMRVPVRILTGDSASAAAAARTIAPTLAELSPQQKHDLVQEWRTDDSAFSRPLFVGDGVNDAAAMAQSHASIALASGAPIAIQTASATLHGGDLTIIPDAIALARRTRQVIRQSLAWAAGYNAVGIVAAVLGFLHPVTAGVLMAASSALIGWRCTRFVHRRAPQPARSPEPATSLALGPAFHAGHWIGLPGQALLLCFIVNASMPASICLLGAAAVAALLIVRRLHLLPAADMTLAMVSLGGLGMNLGWWIDLGFRPAAAICCGSASAGAGWFTWMNAGMLALGVPAMLLLRRTPERFDLRRWCCGGMLLLGVPGMLIGMRLGSQAAALLRPAASLAALLDYALMMAGMCAGMLIPHFAEAIGSGFGVRVPEPLANPNDEIRMPNQ